MKIEPNHIKDKKVVGITPNGMPVFYVQTHGGLHVMIANKSGSMEVLAAMPHRAMAHWITSKKIPDIKWDQQKLLED